MQKTLDIKLPEFLSIEQYRKMAKVNDTTDKFTQLVKSVEILTGRTEEEIRTWSIDSIKDLASEFDRIADPNQEFHALIEWNGTLYGYATIEGSSFGEYLDIENLAKDFENNMHKIAAILYRPVKEHRFKSFEFGS